MKLFLYLVFYACYALMAAAVLAQGSLTPSAGTPGPTMKTLDQIDAKLEKRTPISAPTTITTAGSYYLTQNLTVASGNGITIAQDNVTLDLNGFTISSSANPATGTGVGFTGNRSNIIIRNGHIKGGVFFSAGSYSGAGFVDGIAGSVVNAVLTDLSVSGCLDDGIELGFDASHVVERCSVRTVGGTGIMAGTVRSSIARECGAAAISATTASDCIGVSTSNSVSGNEGISAATANNCRGTANAGSGVGAGTATNCVGAGTVGTGLSATIATNCSGTSDSGIGLSANTAQNCFASSISGNFGIIVQGTASFCRAFRDGGTAIEANIAIGCTVSGTGTVSTPAGNKFLGTP